MVVLKRGGLARVLEPLAHIATDDQQLRKVGELAGTSVYRLRYGNDKAMLFLSRATGCCCCRTHGCSSTMVAKATTAR